MDKEILDILKSMQSDFKEMQSDFKEMKSDFKEMKSEVKEMQSDFREMKSEVKEIKVQLNENTQILRSLEHSSEVNKAEHDNMSNDIAHIKGTVEAINKDLCRVEEATAHNWMDIAKLKAVK